MGVIGGVVGIIGVGFIVGGVVCVIFFVIFLCVVLVNFVFLSVIGFKFLGLMSIVLICFGGFGGLFILR